ncbi:MAG: DUF1080 domain-containing protein [Bacteroidota bacterium]|nr:DUF1080 domain-containing protein [Bacteroidota bacterium]
MRKQLNIPYVLIFLLVCCGKETPQEKSQDETEIFNGKDLTGWHISRTSHQGTTGNFYVEDGAIVLKQNPYGQGGVLLTDRKYKSFELFVEVKIDSFCNGGIFLRSTESGQAYQVELAVPGSNADLFGERMEISLPGKALAISKVWKPDDWNSFRIRMTGDIPRVTLWVNDVEMWDVQQTQNDFTAGAIEGMIGLQSHWSAQYLPTPGGFNMPGAWRPGAAHRFRNIRIKQL